MLTNYTIEPHVSKKKKKKPILGLEPRISCWRLIHWAIRAWRKKSRNSVASPMSITDQTRKVKTRNALAKIRKPNQVEIPRVECFSAPSFWLAAPPVPASSGQSRKIGWHRGSNPPRPKEWRSRVSIPVPSYEPKVAIPHGAKFFCCCKKEKRKREKKKGGNQTPIWGLCLF